MQQRGGRHAVRASPDHRFVVDRVSGRGQRGPEARREATLRGITGLEIVAESQGRGDRITEYRVTLELTFILE
jgi:hypothetical protein